MAQMPIPSAPERWPPTKDYLVLWKDAEPDIPILNAAKAEYAKLQWPLKSTLDVAAAG